MASADLLRQARERLGNLSPDKLRVADDFLAFLELRESEDATLELLAIPGLLSELEEAEKDVEEGRLIPVDALQRRD